MSKKSKSKDVTLKEFGAEIEGPVAMISMGLQRYDLRMRGGILTLLMILWLKELHPKDRKKILPGLHEMLDNETAENDE